MSAISQEQRLVENLGLNQKARAGKVVEALKSVNLGTYVAGEILTRFEFQNASALIGNGGIVLGSMIKRVKDHVDPFVNLKLTLLLFEEKDAFDNIQNGIDKTWLQGMTLEAMPFAMLDFDTSNAMFTAINEEFANEKIELIYSETMAHPGTFVTEMGSRSVYGLLIAKEGFTIAEDNIFKVQLSIAY